MAFLLFIFQNKRRRKRRGTELTSSDKLCDSEVKISCVNKLWLLLLKNEIGVKENDFANNNLLHSHLIRFIFSIFFRLECERECPFRHQRKCTGLWYYLSISKSVPKRDKLKLARFFYFHLQTMKCFWK